MLNKINFFKENIMNSINISAIFVKAYNNIVREIHRVGDGDNLTELPINSQVAQGSLNKLRSAVDGLMAKSKNFDIEYKYDDDDPDHEKTPVDVVPVITSKEVNGGKGWLIVPAMNGNEAVYEYPDPDNRNIHNSIPDTLPVLPEHIQDIISNLNSIDNFSANEGYSFDTVYENGVSKAKANPENSYQTTYFDPEEKSYMLMHGNDLCYSHADGHWHNYGASGGYSNNIVYATYKCTATSDNDPNGNSGNRAIMIFKKDVYFHNEWHDDLQNDDGGTITFEAKWERCAYPTAQISDPIESLEITTGFVGAYEKYEKHIAISPHVIVPVSINVENVPLADNDHSENGLIETGCSASAIGEGRTISDTEIRYSLGSGNLVDGVAKFILYLTNLFVKDTMDEYFFNVETVGVYHWPTTYNFKTSENGDVSIKIGVLRRPNGAYAPIIWQNPGDGGWGEPLTGGGYRVLDNEEEETLTVYFNDGAIHKFTKLGGFSGAYMRSKDGIVQIPQSGISISSASNPTREITHAVEGRADIYYTQNGNLINVSQITFAPEGISVFDIPDDDRERFSHKITISGNRNYMNYRAPHEPLPIEELPAIGGGSISGGAILNPEDAGSYNSTETVSSSEGIYAQTTKNYVHEDDGTWTSTSTTTKGNDSFSFTEQLINFHGRNLPLTKNIGGRITQYGYYDNGLLKYQINPDGSWVYNIYDSDNRIVKAISPFGNIALAFNEVTGEVITPTESSCRVTEYDYTAQMTGDSPLPGDVRPRRVVDKVQNVEISRRYYVYLANEYREIVCRTANATINDANNLVTTYTSYTSGNYKGRQHKVIYPDGTISITTYATTADGETVTTFTGKPNTDKSAVVDGKKIIKTLNNAGLTVQKQEIDIASGLIIDIIQTEYYLGKPYRTTYLDGSEEITEYSCCGIQRHIARDGSEIVYQYTPDHRLAQTTKNQLVTTNEYNATGQIIRTTVFPEGVANASYLLTLREYNNSGELLKEKVAINPVSGSDPADDASYAVTTYSQSKVGDYWRRTRTNPDGSVIYEDYNCDGTLAAVSGSGVAAPCTYSTTVVNGQVCRTRSYARANGENETVSTYTDFAGNSYKTSYSAGNSDIYEYDSAGRVKYHTDVNNVVTFYEYNDKGELYRTSILLGGRHKEDGSDNTPQSNDPVTETVSDCIAAENNSIYGVKRQRVFEYGDNASSGTLVRTTLTSNVDNSTSTNEFGRVTTTVVTYINDESEQGRSEVITYPDNSTLTNSYSGGLLESSTHSVLGTTTYTYNQFNQLESEERNDGGTTVKTVYTYDGRGNNLTQTTTFNGGNSRVYSRTYDKMNRVLTETQPGNRTVTNVYYENGLLKHTSGYGVYPQEYTYENGRKVSMTTWQDEDTPAVTSWSYDLSGRLTAKTYADNSATTYTYGANGKLSRRTWANGVKTDYTYDGAGRLTGVNYSDDTPDVSYVYDRRGRTVQITDGSGTRNLAYNDDNSLKYEELPYFSSYRLEKEYDTLGRLTKTGLKQPNGDNWAYAVSYTYDAMSRLATLSQGGKTLTYSRLANSDRLDKAEFSPASAAPAVEYSYDTKLRLISKGCGTRSFTDKDEVWYFDCPAGTPGNWGTSRYYSYDSMGQLTLAGEGALGPDGQVDNPQNFSYDSIGNHLTNNETYSILNQGSGKTYDANGNMTRNGDDWVALYDGENRLRSVSHPYDGVELLYDYAGRIYQVNDFYMDGVDLPTSTLNYRRIYDGTKLIATVRNGAIEDTFVWQPETSGDADVILWDNSYVYATDPNKNVRVKRFPNDWIPGTWVEEFIDYKPFGELKNYVADPPRFMFSSEEYMPETGMYHYLYRAYSPSLARFTTRDPIEEQGGVNLYCFVNNNPVSYWDKDGAISHATILKTGKCITEKFVIPRITNAIHKLFDKIDINNKVIGYCISNTELPGRDFLSNMKLHGSTIKIDAINSIKSCLIKLKGLENLISLYEKMAVKKSSTLKCEQTNSGYIIKLNITIHYEVYATFTSLKSKQIFEDDYKREYDLGTIAGKFCCPLCSN